MVREAEHWMRTDPDTSVSAVAARVGVSLRGLEAGVRECGKRHRSSSCADPPGRGKSRVAGASNPLR